jgi:hypothetical protein
MLRAAVYTKKKKSLTRRGSEEPRRPSLRVLDARM